MKRPTLVLVIGALGLVAVAAAIGVARAGAMTAPHGEASAVTAPAGCQRLMNDPAAMQVMQTLHADHEKDMQAWRDRYGADPTSPKARQALTTLWLEHRSEMKTAFKQAGIKLPPGVCSRQMMSAGDMMDSDGAGMMGGSGSGSLHEQHHSGATGQASGMMSSGTSGMMSSTF